MEDVSAEEFVLIGGPSGPTISKSALKLHTYAVLVSIEVGRPGTVTDDYLSGIAAETTTAALELTLAGLWTRTHDGYEVEQAETVRVACEVQRHLSALEELRSDL